jgi:hypothetical protein
MTPTWTPPPTSTPTATPTPVEQPAPGTTLLYLTFERAAVLDGVRVENQDIVAWNGAGFSLYFDGSDVGLSGVTLDAFAIAGPGELLLSFTSPANLPGIGSVDDSDIVKFTATSLGQNTSGSFSMYFDGSDVGLSASSEDINAIELLPNGHLLISVNGSVRVDGVSAGNRDILEFAPTSLGDVTAGTWTLYLDGAGVGLAGGSENIDALAVGAGGTLYLSTAGAFATANVSGADEDVFVLTSAGTPAADLFFDGSAYGLSRNDVYDIELP